MCVRNSVRGPSLGHRCGNRICSNKNRRMSMKLTGVAAAVAAAFLMLLLVTVCLPHLECNNGGM